MPAGDHGFRLHRRFHQISPGEGAAEQRIRRAGSRRGGCRAAPLSAGEGKPFPHSEHQALPFKAKPAEHSLRGDSRRMTRRFRRQVGVARVLDHDPRDSPPLSGHGVAEASHGETEDVEAGTDVPDGSRRVGLDAGGRLRVD
jgi:hypothetical protein